MKKILILIIMVFLFSAVNAMEYKVGQNLTLSLVNATDGSLLTGKICNITITNTSGEQVAYHVMDDANDGTYFWAIETIAPNLNVPYMARGNCTVGNNEWIAWMGFYLVENTIANKTDYIANNQDDYKADVINLPTASEVFNGTLSQLQGCGSGSSNLTESVIFNGTLSQLQGCGSGNSNLTNADLDLQCSNDTELITGHGSGLWNNTNITQQSLDNIAAAVWGYATRTLSDFGTLIADIWASTTRTLTNYNLTEIATSVWINTERNLTHGSYNNMNFLNDTQNTDLKWINATVNTTCIGGTSTDYYNSTMNIIIPE